MVQALEARTANLAVLLFHVKRGTNTITCGDEHSCPGIVRFHVLIWHVAKDLPMDPELS